MEKKVYERGSEIVSNYEICTEIIFIVEGDLQIEVTDEHGDSC